MLESASGQASILGFWDYFMIVVYMIAVAGVGIYFKRRATRNLDEYYLGGKKMPWWLLGFCGMSSWFDITGTMIITSFLFMMGPRGLLVELRGGTGLSLAFMMVMMGKWHRRSNVMTKGEWMIYRFGKGFGGEAARLLTAIGFLALIIGLLGYLIRGTGLFLSMFIPLPPVWCALITIIISTVYTAISGFYGVVYTDFLQSVIILAGAATIAFLGFQAVPDLQSLSVIAHQVTGQAEWTRTLPSRFIELPAGYDMYQPLFFIAVFNFLKQGLVSFDQGADSKFFGARNERECGTLSYLWGWLILLRWPLMMGFAVLGLQMVHENFTDKSELPRAAAFIQQQIPGIQKNVWQDQLAEIMNGDKDIAPEVTAGVQQILGPNWKAKLPLVSYEGTVYPEMILPAVMLHSLPKGLRGFILVVLLAAGMSTFTTFANGTGAYFVKDIYQRFMRPRAGNRELILTSYGTTVAIMGLGFVMAYLATSINDIWSWLMGSLISATSLASLLRFFWWRMNGEGVALGTGAGLLFAVIQRYAPIPALNHLEEWHQFLAVLVLSTATAIIASLLTRPTERAVLDNFYRTSRPFGFWGPMRRGMKEEELARIDRENRNDLCALPFAIGWQHLMYFIGMAIVIKDWTTTIVTFVLFLVCQAGLYFLWYRNLPPKDAVPGPGSGGAALAAATIAEAK